jgi:hypothetical protein
MSRKWLRKILNCFLTRNDAIDDDEQPLGISYYDYVQNLHRNNQSKYTGRYRYIVRKQLDTIVEDIDNENDNVFPCS